MTLGVVKKRKHHETELSLPLFFNQRSPDNTFGLFDVSAIRVSCETFCSSSLSVDFFFFF